MGIDFAAPYACLTRGFLEETRLFGLYVPQVFTHEQCTIIKREFKRYMDDGFILWPKSLDMNVFIEILGKLHNKIEYTVEKGKVKGTSQTINMLDVKVVLHDNKKVETEIFYKATNNHHYLEYDSFHPDHTRNNIPYNLAKRVIVFTSDSSKEIKELQKLRKWLTESNYPKRVIDKAFKNARLQGPAPNPKQKKEVIPLVTLHCNNLTNRNIVKQANTLLEHCVDKETKERFQNKRVVLALKQPPNLIRQLTNAKFDSQNTSRKERGLYKCGRSNCKICNLYIIECTAFETASGTLWEIPTYITCQSKKVIYFQKCSTCNVVSNIGKTVDFRSRMNNHISACRLGGSTDIFDNHVHACNKEKQEPFFQLRVLMELNDVNKLLVYENYFHRNGHDTINRTVVKGRKF